MIRHTVYIEAGADRDLQDIEEYTSRHESRSRADAVLLRLETAIAGLACSPQRGSHPAELAESGENRYRQLIVRPYRIIYRVARANVFVMLVADGRRDMRTLLNWRLLGQ